MSEFDDDIHGASFVDVDDMDDDELDEELDEFGNPIPHDESEEGDTEGGDTEEEGDLI